jgi:dynein heavy chain
MNTLVGEIQRTLSELDLGFKGELTISEAMEEMATSLYLDRVPKKWESLAYPSMRSLGAWLSDLQARITQLNDWAGSPQDAPPVMWISGMFNPQSFLTAVMQVTAQAQGLELDRLTLVTEVTRRVVVEEVSAASKDGTFIIGLYLEGASWNLAGGMIESSKPREMYMQLPIINMKPAIVDRFDPGTFMCPVYKTQKRGPTYVFSLQLKTKLEPAKWVLAGVAAVMEVV